MLARNQRDHTQSAHVTRKACLGRYRADTDLGCLISLEVQLEGGLRLPHPGTSGVSGSMDQLWSCQSVPLEVSVWGLASTLGNTQITLGGKCPRTGSVLGLEEGLNSSCVVISSYRRCFSPQKDEAVS
jgi:hypothetical protein